MSRSAQHDRPYRGFGCLDPIRVQAVEFPVPCRRCEGCKLIRKLEWKSRLQLEAAYHVHRPWFITLTYDQDHLPSNTPKAKEHVTNFLRRLKRKVGKLRYFTATEYGAKFGRIHHHAIVFADCPMSLEGARRAVDGAWGAGRSQADPLRGSAGLAYVAKYITKGTLATWSRRPGIGTRGTAAWASAVQALHEQSPIAYRHMLPAWITLPVLGDLVPVRIPKPAVDRLARNLGVPHAPREDPSQGGPGVADLKQRSQVRQWHDEFEEQQSAFLNRSAMSQLTPGRYSSEFRAYLHRIRRGGHPDLLPGDPTPGVTTDSPRSLAMTGG